MEYKDIAKGFDANAYLKALIAVALADGGMAPEEMNFIEIQAKLLALDLDRLLREPEQNLKKLAHRLPHKTKMIIIRDCISMAHMDAEYAESERKRILEIAQELDLGAEEVTSWEEWLLEYWAVLERGDRLIDGEQGIRPSA